MPKGGKERNTKRRDEEMRTGWQEAEQVATNRVWVFSTEIRDDLLALLLMFLYS